MMLDTTATLPGIEAPDTDIGKRARAMKITNRHLFRRARAESVLAEVLPERLAPGDSWHVISHGDIDSMSYVAHVIKGQPLDYLMISTWVMAAPDVRLLERWVDEQRIGRLDFNFGEHMPAEYGDIYMAASQLAQYTGGTAKIARNHSKVALLANFVEGFYCAIEISANVNTNPRIEQTALHCSRELYAFYREFFDGIQTIHKPK